MCSVFVLRLSIWPMLFCDFGPAEEMCERCRYVVVVLWLVGWCVCLSEEILDSNGVILNASDSVVVATVVFGRQRARITIAMVMLSHAGTRASARLGYLGCPLFLVGVVVGCL